MQKHVGHHHSGMIRTTVEVGIFLGLRQLWRSGRGVSVLIIFIMTLTFLNLVVVRGILVGLVKGSSNAYRAQYSSDLLVTNLSEEAVIEQTSVVSSRIESYPDVQAYTRRLTVPASVEANYKTTNPLVEEPDRVGAELAGIDLEDEDAVTGLSERLVEGRPLEQKSSKEILIGSGLIDRFIGGGPPDEGGLKDAHVGDRVLLIVGGARTEVTVRGIVQSKIQNVNRRIFMNRREVRQLAGRIDSNVNEIAVKLVDGGDPDHVKKDLLASGTGELATVQTWRDSQGEFFDDIETTFGVLGNVIGSIALAVAALTVFIVVLINALTRKKYIGIMKGIGICGMAIEISYIIQSLIYAMLGTGLGLALLYLVIKPYFDVNPIDFPFSDGIIVAPPDETMWRVLVLMLVTFVAGYLPARYIVGKNTLDTILGR